VISPKTRIKEVMTRVEIAMAASSLKNVEMIFSPRLEAAILTKVLPKRMVANTRTGFSIILAIDRFLESLFPANSLSFPCPKLKRAVSDPEKKPDRQSSIRRSNILKINFEPSKSDKANYYRI
jgi:hypothetical protein